MTNQEKEHQLDKGNFINALINLYMVSLQALEKYLLED